MQYDSEKLNDAARDDMAELVIQRFKRGVDYKNDRIVHQGLSFQKLAERASAQYRREYTQEDAQKMTEDVWVLPNAILWFDANQNERHSCMETRLGGVQH